ncbi:hypothetical protein [uncultured Nostoc sp.]|uniref:hypothetical protein n=1 Tax=uncultured Nostoc sp. TaxID=340711 RepID=UPI0035C97D12
MNIAIAGLRQVLHVKRSQPQIQLVIDYTHRLDYHLTYLVFYSARRSSKDDSTSSLRAVILWETATYI